MKKLLFTILIFAFFIPNGEATAPPSECLPYTYVVKFDDKGYIINFPPNTPENGTWEYVTEDGEKLKRLFCWGGLCNPSLNMGGICGLANDKGTWEWRDCSQVLDHK